MEFLAISTITLASFYCFFFCTSGIFVNFKGMELDAYECGMLDALLETLAVTGSLTTAQLYEIFNDDEDFALSLADILVGEGLAGEAGYAQGSKMPLLLNLEKKGRVFLENGGFTACYHREVIKKTLPRQHYFPALFTSAFKLIFR